jgi:hypothetical protein
MSRRARRRTSLFGLTFLLIGIPFWWIRIPHPTAVLPTAVMVRTALSLTPPADFPSTLIRSGLDPKALAAAGVSSGSISSVLAAAASQINSAPTALSSADDALAAARTQVDQLTTKIQSGHGTQDDITALATANSGLATATSQRQATLDAIFSAATANLTNAQQTALATIRANRSWDLPLEFLTVNREQSEWVAVRDALANERVAVSLPDSLNQTAQSNLATWRADPSVSAAKSSLDSNLSGVTTSWNSTAGQ